jgi:hypothetical protein
MTFCPNKPVQTRDGRKARIIATDAKGAYPIIALIYVAGDESVRSYCSDGRRWIDEDSDDDLINVPERRTVDLTVPDFDGNGPLLITRHQTDSKNLRLTFEGNKLIAAEVIG